MTFGAWTILLAASPDGFDETIKPHHGGFTLVSSSRNAGLCRIVSGLTTGGRSEPTKRSIGNWNFFTDHLPKHGSKPRTSRLSGRAEETVTRRKQHRQE